jgi:hypothetical protein
MTTGGCVVSVSRAGASRWRRFRDDIDVVRPQRQHLRSAGAAAEGSPAARKDQCEAAARARLLTIDDDRARRAPGFWTP